MKSKEAQLQSECIRWFRLQYPNYAGIIFAIPNGGSRNVIEAANLKRQGVTAGVADVILLLHNTQYNSLCIEFKYGRGKQTQAQLEFQAQAEKYGNRYIVVNSFDDFAKQINDYLNG